MNKMTKASSSSTMLWVIGSLLVGILIGMYMRKGFLENFSDGKSCKFYSMKGCPHCVAFQSEWDKFEKTAPSMGVSAEQIDSSDERTRAAGVTSFPTVIINVSGKDTVYEGKRTASALSKFIQDLS